MCVWPRGGGGQGGHRREASMGLWVREHSLGTHYLGLAECLKPLLGENLLKGCCGSGAFRSCTAMWGHDQIQTLLKLRGARPNAANKFAGEHRCSAV